ncbi:MAG: PorV/PorQ family protein [Phycisphaerae bacterium]|nr:PorV/PorQ family protein [candidate division KSB1 bacterium]NIU56082.1 PorV/PorQ family protein [Phycisphaerae bacterium]NIU93175.1 PorV/PorQ family protein [candidate division KSB1 bacterium]NIV95732.1 PorV/PorQ family protein [candidate division KSB1 bacterium]NIW92601.1 PorV/PorQ family protein [Phycisphaerae bacterium]
MRSKLFFTANMVLMVFAQVVWSQETPFVSDVSKKGTTAAAFLEIGVGARALAMGSAFVALADDPTTIYWNVAGLAKSEKHGVSFTHNDWIADTKFDFIVGSFKLGRYGTVGVSFTNFSVGDMEVRTVDEPEGTGQVFGGNDVAFSLAYAMNLTDNFSMGLATKFIQQSIWDMSASAFAVDVGVHYRLPFKGFRLGAVMTNFGSDLKMSGDNTLILHDPDLATTGNNGRIPADLQMESWSLPLNFQVGIAYTAVHTELHKINLAADALHPNNNYESLNLGAEYVFNEFLALRVGYKSLFLQDSEEAYTWGLGIQKEFLGNVKVILDFAYADFGRLENSKKFSFAIEF